MNQFIEREATEEDQSFILNLWRTKLPSYDFHRKPRARFQATQYGEEKEKRDLIVEEVEILSVCIVLSGAQKVGAYYIDSSSSDKACRLYWLASTERVKGVCCYIISQAKLYAKARECSLINVSVNRRNSKAIKCYCKAGFVKNTTPTNVSEEFEMVLDMAKP